jgi:lysophospholipase L1-like esterase
MFGASRPQVRISLRRLTLLTAGLVPVVLIFVITLYWLYDHVPGWYYWKAGLIFLIALEIFYWFAAVLTVFGGVALGFLLFLGRRGRHRSMISRAFLLCVALIFGLIVAETVGAIWQHRSHQRTAIPVGGLRDDTGPTPSSGVTRAPQEITLPTTFDQAKEIGEINVVIVGESSAEGVPYNFWISIGQIVRWRLMDVLPGRSIRVEVVATSGDTLETQHEKLSTLNRRPDVLIIYCGHNEFSARFVASSDRSHYFDDRLPTVWTLLADRMEAVSSVTRLIRETAEKCRIAIPPPINGNRALVDTPVYTRTEHDTLLSDFRRRLELIVSYAERIGALPILVIPPANDAGFEPNRSFLPADTARDQREVFAKDFLAARRIEGTDPKHSLELYRALLARQPGFAETHYRMAQLLERDGAWDEAYQHYVMARDFDGYPMRMLSAFQHTYREVAARHDSILIDGQSYFHAIGRHGLLDDALFHDGIHPSLRGQIALAQAILQALQKRRAFGWPLESPAVVIDPASCAKRFGLTTDVWRRICLWGIMFYDRTSGARYDSSHRLDMKGAFASAAVRIKSGEAPESVGLPNVGVPEPVPDVPMPDSDRSSR